MSSFSIPPLCLPAVAVNPIHTKCTDLQAYRHKNTEDQFTFMKRVCELSTGEEVHNASYVISQFISLLVDDPLLFRQILDDLESLHIDDGYGKTLFSCILNNGNFEQILLLVEGLKKRNAFSRRKAFEVTLTLYRRKNELQESDALERLLEEVNVPFVNEQGLLENLIFAAHLSDLDLSLIELLNQKKVALPLTEIAIGSAVRNTLSDSAAYLFKTLSKQELRDIIHLSRLRPYFQKTQDAPCTVHIDLPLRPLLVVINTQDLLFDLALGSFEVLEKLCYIVHSANDEQLSQVLQSWLEGKVGPITRLVTSHILSKKSLNSLKQQAFKEEMKNSFLYRWLLEFASQQLPTLKAAFEYNFFLCRVQTSTYRLQTFRSVSRRDIQNVLVLQHMKETSQARNSLKKAAVRLLELFLETAIEVDPVRCTEHKRSMVFYLQDRKRRSHKYEVINYGHAVIQDERRLFTPSFPVASIFRDLKYFLNGDEVEYVGEGGDQSKNLKDNTLWSTEWKFGIARRFYENTAYPILGQIACNILCSRG